MHEISLCESIVEILQERARTEQFRRVKRVRLEIGRLSCVEPEALRFAFDIVAKNSVAEYASLEIEEVAGQGWCQQCRRQVVMGHRYDACSQCGYYPLQLKCGDEMRIKYVEVV